MGGRETSDRTESWGTWAIREGASAGNGAKVTNSGNAAVAGWLAAGLTGEAGVGEGAVGVARLATGRGATGGDEGGEAGGVRPEVGLADWVGEGLVVDEDRARAAWGGGVWVVVWVAVVGAGEARGGELVEEGEGGDFAAGVDDSGS